MTPTKTVRQPNPNELAQTDASSIVRSVFDRHLVVEAGAGTGKTWLLIERMVSLLREQRASIDRIVAITFTEKAAAEIRGRLRQELRKAWEGAEAPDRARWARAWEDLDKAPINTIHGFAASLVKEYPVESRIDPGAAVEDEARSVVRFEGTWNAWIREELSRDDPAWREILTEHTLFSVKELARLMMRNREIVGREDLSVGDPVQFMQQEALALQAQADALRGALSACHYAKDPILSKADPMLEWVDGCVSLYEHHGALVERCLAPVACRKTSARTWKDRWESEEAFERGRDAFNALVDGIRAMEPCALDVAKHHRTVKAIAKLREFLERVEQGKRADGILDFDDLLVNARDLLRDHPHVRRRVQEQCRYLLVDEFQDTDPVQAELVMWLGEAAPRATDWRDVALEPGKLFLVGDPKQSIYGWRKASLAIYREVTELVLRQNGLFLTLERNYRSDERVLHVVNDVFSRLMVEAPPYQPLYRELIPDRLSEQAAPRVEVLLTESESAAEPDGTGDSDDSDSSSGSDDNWSVAQYRRAEAAVLAQRIRDLAEHGLPDGRPVAYGKMAMLFRSLGDLGLYEEALRMAGVPYLVAGGRNYYQRAEIVDLLNVFRCVDNPADAVSVVGVLRSPVVGLSDDEIFELSQQGECRFDRPIPGSMAANAALCRAYDVLGALSDMAHTVKVSEMIEWLFERTSWLVVLSAMPGGEQQIANLRKILKTAARHEEDGALSVKRWVGLLSELLKAHEAEGDSPLAEEGADAVRLMTIHKSKGLEFDVVLLPDANRDLARNKRGGELSADEGAGWWGCSVKGLQTVSWRQGIADNESARTLAEELRLGYVALTRARECVVIAGSAAEVTGYSLLQWMGAAMGVSWGAMSDGEWRRDGARVRVARCARPDERLRIRRVTLQDLMQHEPSADWKSHAEQSRLREEAYRESLRIDRSRIAQVTALAAEQVISDKSQVTSANPDGSESKGQRSRVKGQGSSLDQWRAREFGRRTGILVHEVLERLDFTPGGDSDGAPWKVWLRRRVRAEADLSPDDQARLHGESLEMLEQLVKSSFFDRLSKATRVDREVPVLFFGGDGPVRDGRLDLMFEEDGALYLVDYKTDRRIQDDLSSYSKQLGAYREAVEALMRRSVRTALYYVRHDQWIDVE